MTDPAAMRNALLLLLLSPLVVAQDVEPDFAIVTWQHPEQWTDDSPLSLNDIEATEVEYGPCPPTDASWTSITINAPTSYVVSIPLPSPGLWCFRARTKAFGELWSEWTEPVIRESPPTPYTGPLLPPFKLVM